MSLVLVVEDKLSELKCFVFVSRTIKVVLPDPPPEYSSLPHWLSDLIDSKLKKLLDQGDFQRVRELSLVLITVLNEVGRWASSHQDGHFLKCFPCKITVWTFFKICFPSMSRHENLYECHGLSVVTEGGSATTSPEL